MTKKYLLDTNVFIAALKGHPLVCQRLEILKPAQILLSSIVLGELVLGAEQSQQVQKNLAKLKKIESQFELIQLDKTTMYCYGEIRAKLEQKGLPIGANDTWIAAQALSHHVIMVTDNVREFSRIEHLHLENWLRE